MSTPVLETIEADLSRALLADRYRLRQKWRNLARTPPEKRGWGDRVAQLQEELARSIAEREARRQNVPAVTYDEQLPIAARREEIARVIAAHPVVIVCGETGSGKSTQLPKICLELGRGIDGMIGHTQPRRIAARSVAARLAEELQTPLGGAVGFKVRFAEALGPRTYVKLMTDGILLAELQSDRFLEQYDTLIIDEAHERSLNIDFLLGQLHRLRDRRPDLKIIITSATIDAARFSSHFASPAGPAPIVEVAGRTWPVEVRWRPLENDDDSGEPDLMQAVVAAVEEVSREGPGDVLVFMPTERDIHEAAKALRSRQLAGGSSEILPLYARLSIQEQQRVFHPHPGRRIVIATNVAESSLTVPGIRYVVDPGTARISRYAARSKTQRLPIEPISQASADQRMGRCGRVGPGVCVRLYSQEDYQTRERYTPPEIQRTNLAAVILQCKAFRFGPIESFPFLDPPRPEAIRDGYKTLYELGALDEKQELTPIGRQLSRLPVDPRIGRMILAANREGCLQELLIIAAALEVQDPRERPLERQEEADAAHERFLVPGSDFLSYLKMWDFYQGLKTGWGKGMAAWGAGPKTGSATKGSGSQEISDIASPSPGRRSLSRNQLRRACRQYFLSHNRMREWVDVYLELRDLVRRGGFALGPRKDQSGAIHRAILTGLLSNVARRSEKNVYSVAGGGKFQLWPGSATYASPPKWLVAAELVETTRRYLRTCAAINPRWIEPIAQHLLSRRYSNIRWDAGMSSAVADRQTLLLELTIDPRRIVPYGEVDPRLSRELLIEHGLVQATLHPKPEFLEHNESLQAEVEQLQAKLRRSDLALDRWARFRFYDRRLPAEVVDGKQLTRWLRRARQHDPRVLQLSAADLVPPDAAPWGADQFPDDLEMAGTKLPLSYHFEPGSPDDGLTVTLPLEAMANVDLGRMEWLVPGMVEAKVLALIRSLPKELRRLFLPATDTAKRVAELLRFAEGDFYPSVAAALTSAGGQRIGPDDFQADKLPESVRMNYRIQAEDGRELARGRDLGEIRRRLGLEVAHALRNLDDPQWHRDGLRDWDFDLMPVQIQVRRSGLLLPAWPTLVDQGHSVGLRLANSAEQAEHLGRFGLRRLYATAQARALRTQVAWWPQWNQIRVYAAAVSGLDLEEQVALLLADRAFVGDEPLPRSRSEYEQRLQDAEPRIAAAVQDVTKLLLPLWEGFHNARLALEQATAPRARFAVADLRQHLSELFRPDFLTATPWTWLRQYPRYLEAMVMRLDRVTAGSFERDRQATDEIAAYEEAYRRQSEQLAQTQRFDPALEHFRWMVEEYRVSLFAQKLGTALPVSATRLQRLWERIAADG